MTNGRALYLEHCANCHGKGGKGDGADAANLERRPRDHTDGRYMNPLGDANLIGVIKGGGKAVKKSKDMPGFGRTLSEEEIRDLVAFIRTLARPPFERR